MADDNFFETPEEQNIVKTRLVSQYFGAWSTVMLRQGRDPQGRIAYIDLFSGPGRFDDGTPSTPLWVLNHAIKNSELCARLVTMFNDKEADYALQLRAAIANLPGIEKLRYQPQVSNTAVGAQLVDLIRNLNLVPTLFFIDPWGYKGLSLDLIGNAIKSWGCDCIFFFNYNRINPGINNPFVVERMNELFGPERAAALREQVAGRTSEERQAVIISELSEALKELGGRFVLPFEFQRQHGARPSHYIIFVSKAFLGYHIMKEVMFSLSTDEADVRQFEYVPVKSSQMSLFADFGRSHSIPLLKNVLVRAWAERSVRVWDIYEGTTVDTPYTIKNVKDAILELETEGAVTVDKPPEKRRRSGKVTLGDNRIVTFLS